MRILIRLLPVEENVFCDVIDKGCHVLTLTCNFSKLDNTIFLLSSQVRFLVWFKTICLNSAEADFLSLSRKPRLN